MTNVAKRYVLYDHPAARLKDLIWPRTVARGREFWALREVSLTLERGQVLGIVGRNGAGKSTLLQLVCGTLQPTLGSVEVNGRVAALLELGAGFNPEFTGRENVFMNAAILGATEEEVADKFDSIVEFSGVRDFIDQPVKTYSSGMFVRLAFSVATAFEPDILVIDEALSVGDGAFARKSFERIMTLKDKGATILFCSHSLYQVEMLCQQAIWLDKGRVMAYGPGAEVTRAYREYIDRAAEPDHRRVEVLAPSCRGAPDGTAHIEAVKAYINGRQIQGRQILLRSRRDCLDLEVIFSSDPSLPTPSLALSIVDQGNRLVCGIGNVNDGVTALSDAAGRGVIGVSFPNIPLLKGRYTLNLILACERALHPYDQAMNLFEIEVVQDDHEQGIVDLPHRWQVGAGTGMPGRC